MSEEAKPKPFSIGSDTQDRPVLREFPDTWPWPRVDYMNERLKKAESSLKAVEADLAETKTALTALTARVTALEASNS